LLAIAAVCSLKEECRKQVGLYLSIVCVGTCGIELCMQVIEAKILPHIVQAMEHTNVGVRAAACQCTRSLSRSVKNLRTALVDAGVAVPLFKVSSDTPARTQA
jgi:hypothetical protein